MGQIIYVTALYIIKLFSQSKSTVAMLYLIDVVRLISCRICRKNVTTPKKIIRLNGHIFCFTDINMLSMFHELHLRVTMNTNNLNYQKKESPISYRTAGIAPYVRILIHDS